MRKFIYKSGRTQSAQGRKPALNYLVAEDRERVKGGEAACEALDVSSVFCYQPASSSCISMCFMLMYFFPAPLGSGNMTQSGAYQHQSRMAIGKVPTTRVLRRISRFRRSMALLVRIFCQCSGGKSIYVSVSSILSQIFFRSFLQFHVSSSSATASAFFRAAPLFSCA